MHISNVKLALTEKDVMSIINDFVKVNNLVIHEVLLDDQVTLKGSYKALATLEFLAKAEIMEADGKSVRLKISSVKLYKLGIMSFIRNLSLKIALKKLNKEGITFEDNLVHIDLDKLLKDVPFVTFDLASAFIEGGLLNVEVNNINLNIDKFNASKDVQLEAEGEEEQQSDEVTEDGSILQEEEQEIEVEKVSDYYTEIRSSLGDKLPDSLEDYSDYAFLLTDILALLVRILRDKRVSVKVKLILGASIAYISSPLDILPDKIPFIGKLDDIGVVVFALSKVIEEVPKEIIISNWSGADSILVVLENLLTIAKRFTSGARIDKIYSFMDDIITA